MRDTSTAQETGYGYPGETFAPTPDMLNLSQGLAGYGDDLSFLPVFLHGQIVDEIENDDDFCSHIAPMLKSSNPNSALQKDLAKVVSNELDPTTYPDSAGWWSVLRAKFRKALSQVSDDVTSGHSPKAPPDQELMAMARQGMRPVVDALVLAYQDASGSGESIGLGQLDIWGTIGNAISTLAPKALDIYQTTLNQKVAEATAKAAQAQQALLQQAQVQQQQTAAQSSILGAGIPGWVTPVAIAGVAGVALYMMFGRSKGRR